jgi:large subunit ribosomal protein L3
MKFILGKKIGMSQIFDKKENVIPVTVIEAGPCFVTQIKSQDKDNYSAVQIGYEKLKDKKISKSKKKKPYRYLKEIRIMNHESEIKIGDKITVDVFEEGDVVKVSGISKGKGFQGVVKRHGFSGGPASHGHRHVLRTPGSIGSAFPQRVVKGKKMPGHAGAERVTTTGLKVVKVDKENNLLAVKGAIPGPNGGLIEIKSQ